MIVQTPLMALLDTLRVQTIRLGFLELGEPWGGTVPAQDHLSIHLVMEGHAWVSADEKSFLLDKGDMVFVGQKLQHRLADSKSGDRGADTGWGTKDPGEQVVISRELGGDGPRSQLLCMALSAEGPANTIINQSLPNIMALRSDDDGIYRAASGGTVASGLAEIVHAIEVEASSDASELVLTRLAEALLIVLVRSLAHKKHASDSGSVSSSNDDLNRVLFEMYSHPSTQWSVASLAKVARMSRSTFAAYFVDNVGVAPMTYLTSWRMEVAHDALQHGTKRAIGDVATQVGYTSDGAFSQAFRQHWGYSPRSLVRETSDTKNQKSATTN